VQLDIGEVCENQGKGGISRVEQDGVIKSVKGLMGKLLA